MELGIHARRILRKDVPLLVQWLTHPNLAEKIEDDGVCEPQSAYEKFNRLCNSDPISDCECGILIEMDGRPMAFIHFMWINWVSRNAEIDFFLDPLSPHRPFMSRSVIRKMGQIAFEEYQLNKIYGFVFGFNSLSLAFHRRLMREEAQLRRYLPYNGSHVDVHVFGLLADEYFKHPLARTVSVESATHE